MEKDLTLWSFVCSLVLQKQVLEFLRALAADPCALKPEQAGDGSALDRVFGWVGKRELVEGTFKNYLANSDHREFARLFLLALISSSHPWQPNPMDPKWEVVKDLIDEILAVKHIVARKDDAYELTEHGRRFLLEYITYTNVASTDIATR